MGRDKALLTLAGRPLIAHALAALRGAGMEPAIAGDRSDLAHFAPIVADAEPGQGPLGGICAALESASARFSVFLPVDLPLLPSSLIDCLLHRAQIAASAMTIPSVCGAANPFPAILERRMLAPLRAELNAGRRGCLAAFHAAAAALGQQVSVVAAELLVQSGLAAHPLGLPVAFWFLNVNAGADLARTARLLGEHIA